MKGFLKMTLKTRKVLGNMQILRLLSRKNNFWWVMENPFYYTLDCHVTSLEVVYSEGKRFFDNDYVPLLLRCQKFSLE